MFERVELFLIGVAAVIDAVLTLIVLERVNRREFPVWLRLSVISTLLFHFGIFAHILLGLSQGRIASLLDDASMLTIVAGLVLMPCSLLHGGLRLYFTGDDPRPPLNVRFAAIYLPVLLFIPAAQQILTDPDRSFRPSLGTLPFVWGLWMLMANTATAWCFWNCGPRLRRPQLRSIARQEAGLFILNSLVLLCFLFVPPESPNEPAVRLIIEMSPLLPLLMFVWSSYRFRLFPVIVERTIVYGAALLIVMWLHHFAVAPLTSALGQRVRFDFVVLEIVLFVALILAWTPLRQRVRDSLRYLFSSHVRPLRTAISDLSVQLPQQASRSADDLVYWLCREIAQCLDVESAQISVLSESQLHVAYPRETAGNADVDSLTTLLGVRRWMTISDAGYADQALLEILQQERWTGVFQSRCENIRACLLVGNRQNLDRIPGEQCHAVSLLLDQFTAWVLHQRREEFRRAAERRMAQREKLATLGLLSSAIAHEIRNPLSSIRTLDSLLAEELPANSEQKTSADLIIGEIDRLTETSNRLLESARPADDRRTACDPDVVLGRIFRLMQTFAKQRGVNFTSDQAHASTMVLSTEASLTEICMNLIRNAIEATAGRTDGTVILRTRDSQQNTVTIEIEDNGPGIPPHIRMALFQPFVTGKEDGNGLGLFIARERVRELGGTLQCIDRTAGGTIFRLSLPCSPSQTADVEDVRNRLR